MSGGECVPRQPAFLLVHFGEAASDGPARKIVGYASLANIEATAQRIVGPLGQNDVMLVMLSGHGQQLSRDPTDTEHRKDEAFYCPVDAVANDPATEVALSHLLDDILAPNVGRKLLLVDACRDVPLDAARGARNTKGIQGRVVSLPEDTAVFFSCRAGQQSFERAELGHGLFTYCVLEGLRGAATVEGELAWSILVAHVGRRMTQPDLTRFMPRNLPQVPIPAGALPHTVLGQVAKSAATTPTNAGAAAVRPQSVVPSPSPAPAPATPPVATPRPPLPVATFDGTWVSTQYGSCTLTRTSNRVTGRMVYPNGNQGSLTGTVSGNTINFTWSNGTDAGTGQLSLSADGRALTGYWISNKTGTQADWRMTRK